MGYAAKLRKFRPDVLLPYNIYPNLLAGVLWKVSGVRGCIWQQRDEGRMRRYGLLETQAVASTPAFIANSTAGRLFLEDSLRVPTNRIRVVMNGVDLPVPARTRNAWRVRLGIEESILLGCMIANLHSYKDHETLFRAWRIVVDAAKRHGMRSMLLLAGRFDNTHEKLKALASDLEVAENVRFLGAVKDIAGLLGAVDFGVFSSRNEGCPNGVLECMANGLAVAATDIPGTRDALGAEGRSMLSPPGDCIGLAANILRLLCDADLRYQEGERNRRRITQVFGAERMCAETTETIAAVLKTEANRTRRHISSVIS
jgi:glycosyltransferase involved in cell wall biosynthesis